MHHGKEKLRVFPKRPFLLLMNLGIERYAFSWERDTIMHPLSKLQEIHISSRYEIVLQNWCSGTRFLIEISLPATSRISRNLLKVKWCFFTNLCFSRLWFRFHSPLMQNIQQVQCKLRIINETTVREICSWCQRLLSASSHLFPLKTNYWRASAKKSWIGKFLSKAQFEWIYEYLE